MDLELGVVCGRCDAYSPLGSPTCRLCDGSLALAAPLPEVATPPPPVLLDLPPVALAKPWPAPFVEVAAGSAVDPPMSPLFAGDDLKPRRPASGSVPAALASAVRAQGRQTGVSSPGSPEEWLGAGTVHDTAGNVSLAGSRAAQRARPERSLEEQMDQAKNYVCKSCSTPVPLGHKFCGRCGAAVPPEILHTRTHFFGQLQTPGKAKLILIRGEGIEGLSYQLNAEQHIVGRIGQLVLPDDPYVSPRHANLFYRAGKLVVRDEGSLNGVYWRVRGTVEVSVGDHFLAGEQLFRIDGPVKANDGPAPDGTYFYSSPKHPAQFKLVQILQGGVAAMAVCARGAGLQIGREGADLNFPTDLYMSASHCRLEETGGRLTLTDLNSRNGTYVRLQVEKELSHGDYLFIGRKLLRVEVTT
ncbi:MAG TPA: FHA domain-containing protein [Polyangiaceae bacterium]|jgi:pSer/pThr/pTyr-binding forkhead associated (FHA) protein/ribosomal protein L40E